MQWYWGYWPAYWYSWSPYYWHYYYGYHYNWYDHYYAHYRHCDHYRYNRYNDFYYHNVRAHSPLVAININNGHYKSTYSRPESRRDGEALGAKAYSERGSRMQNNTNVSRVDRRTTNNQSTGDQGRLTTSSTFERRTAGTINNGSRTQLIRRVWDYQQIDCNWNIRVIEVLLLADHGDYTRSDRYREHGKFLTKQQRSHTGQPCSF
jgi:hypothetical protein